MGLVSIDPLTFEEVQHLVTKYLILTGVGEHVDDLLPQIRDSLYEPNNVLWAFELDGMVVGYIYGSIGEDFFGKIGLIRHIYTAVTGKRIGRFLYTTFKEFCKQKDCNRVGGIIIKGSIMATIIETDPVESLGEYVFLRLGGE